MCLRDVWTQAPFSVVITSNEPGIQHLSENPFCLAANLRMGLELGILLEDLLQKSQFLLDGLLLGERLGLLLLDLRLGSSALAPHLHEVGTGTARFYKAKRGHHRRRHQGERR